jgi:transposase
MAPIRRRIESLLLRGVYLGRGWFRGMCRELFDHRDWLWTCGSTRPIVPPFRRPGRSRADQQRQRTCAAARGDLAETLFRYQNAAGRRFVEAMLSVIETCRQQSRQVLAFVTQAVQNHVSGRRTLSLVPRV